MVDDTSHLLPDVQELINKPCHERIKYLKKDNWIGYGKALNCLSKLYSLKDHPRQVRMPNLLIIAPSNNGKSMIVEKFFRDHKPILYNNSRQCRSQIAEMPVLLMQMPSTPDMKRFYMMLLDSLGKSMKYHGVMLPYLETELYQVLTDMKVKIIIIDEIHNILAGTNRQQLEFLNLLRLISNKMRIPLVCVGTKDAYLAIRSDPQLENRFEPFILPIWQHGFEYESLLASFVKVLPLKKKSELNMPVIANSILTKSEGVIGEISAILKEAAINAIYSCNEQITMRTLKNIDYFSPSERKRIFEQQLV